MGGAIDKVMLLRKDTHYRHRHQPTPRLLQLLLQVLLFTQVPHPTTTPTSRVSYQQRGVVGGIADEDAPQQLRAGLVEEQLLVGVVERVIPGHGDLVVFLLMVDGQIYQKRKRLSEESKTSKLIRRNT